MNDDELWEIFQEKAEPEQEFADTSADNKEAILKAMKAVYSLGFKNGFNAKIEDE